AAPPAQARAVEEPPRHLLRDHDDVEVAELVRRRGGAEPKSIVRAYELLEPRCALDILLYIPDEYDTIRADGNPADRGGRARRARVL
ncbi:MAG: hypothetical protein M3292_09460, partial [Actinomycetota bacterium]|nr:hypothetical protein [Actinomycetota bacterium]